MLGCMIRIHLAIPFLIVRCMRRMADDYNYFYSGFVVHHDGKISKKGKFEKARTTTAVSAAAKTAEK